MKNLYTKRRAGHCWVFTPLRWVWLMRKDSESFFIVKQRYTGVTSDPAYWTEEEARKAWSKNVALAIKLAEEKLLRLKLLREKGPRISLG